MSSLSTVAPQSNKSLKFNFSGGDISSDGGLLLLKEFIHRLGFENVIRQKFKTNDPALFRVHTDKENLMQRIYQIFSGYFNDDDADELVTDPIFRTVLGKDALASQPTMSRFYNRLDDASLEQFEAVHREMRRRIYSVKAPKFVLLDLDSTLLGTFGGQEGEAFNYHYQAHGYHPLVCYDGITRDLLKIELRNGTDYSCTGVVPFLTPVLDEYLDQYPDTMISLRGDSGFASPELYDLAETKGCSYAVRLKINSTLTRLCADVTSDLDDLTAKNKIDYAVCYGEFMYQAGKWKYPSRVVCKVEKPVNQMTYMYTFIVTNMELAPEELIHYYCGRGLMENFIKESKNGFDFSCMSSHSKTVNAGRLQICMLAYNLFNWFRRMVLPQAFSKMQVDTIRLKLLKIAARAVHSARYIVFRFCSSCPYQSVFYETLDNIRRLPQLAA